MSLNRVLVFSSSRYGNGGYLSAAAPVIKSFLDNAPLNIAFIPFASVGNDYDEYASMVRAGLAELPHTINAVKPDNAKVVIGQSDVIMVGGGNTFKLLHDIYKYQLLDIIRDKINAGIPYIGWSAGSNITGPTIATTNDMPIIEPRSFNALGFLPFQINPHYTNKKIEGHNGESRDQRLQEFLILNPGVPIVALPEGTALLLDKGVLNYLGEVPAILFSKQSDTDEIICREIHAGEDLSGLL
jgi:dipeptidase E